MQTGPGGGRFTSYGAGGRLDGASRLPEWKQQQLRAEAEAAAASLQECEEAALTLCTGAKRFYTGNSFCHRRPIQILGVNCQLLPGLAAAALQYFCAPALASQVNGYSAPSPPSWIRSETDSQPTEQKCLPSETKTLR